MPNCKWLPTLTCTPACTFTYLLFQHPHRRQLQSQQQTWSREDVKTDGAPKNEYTALTLRPSSGYPASPGMSSPTSDQFLANIDPKWEFPRENIKLCDPLCEGQFTVLYKGLATGIKEKPVDVAIKSVRGMPTFGMALNCGHTRTHSAAGHFNDLLTI